MSQEAAQQRGRTRADALRNREKILAAARERFADGGASIPLDDIAAHAGVGPGTLHRHFSTKTALLSAVLLDELAQRVDQAEAAASASTAGDAFRCLLESMVADGVRSKALKESLTATGVDLRQAAPEAHAAFAAALARALTAAQHEGAVRSDVDVSDVLALLAAALAATTYAQRAGRPPDRAAALVLDTLRPT